MSRRPTFGLVSDKSLRNQHACLATCRAMLNEPSQRVCRSVRVDRAVERRAAIRCTRIEISTRAMQSFQDRRRVPSFALHRCPYGRSHLIQISGVCIRSMLKQCRYRRQIASPRCRADEWIAIRRQIRVRPGRKRLSSASDIALCECFNQCTVRLGHAARARIVNERTACCCRYSVMHHTQPRLHGAVKNIQRRRFNHPLVGTETHEAGMAFRAVHRECGGFYKSHSIDSMQRP